MLDPKENSVWRARLLMLTGVLGTMILFSTPTGCSKQAPPPPLEKTPWLDPAKQIKLIQSSDFKLQMLGTRNLGKAGAAAADAIPELEKLLENKNPKVVKEASAAIEKIRAAMTE